MPQQLETDRIKEAYETAVKYLAVSPRSEKEVREKLYSKGFHRDEVDGAIEKAKGYKYIDDEAYVKAFLESYKTRYGLKKLAYRLTNEKGVDKALADNVIADVISDEEELETATRIAGKYVKQKKLADVKDANKVWAYLYQKGFENRVISKAVSTFFDDTDFAR